MNQSSNNSPQTSSTAQVFNASPALESHPPPGPSSNSNSSGHGSLASSSTSSQPPQPPASAISEPVNRHNLRQNSIATINLKNYHGCCRQAEQPRSFSVGIQDVLTDGTCPRIRYLERYWGSRPPQGDDATRSIAQDSPMLADCPGNVRSRFFIICADQSGGWGSITTLTNLSEYQTNALMEILPIEVTDLWHVIEQSPAFPA